MNVVGALLLLAASAMAQSAPVVELLLPGVNARPTAAGTWLALRPTRDGFAWERTAVRVQGGKAHTEGEMPLVLVRGLPQLFGKPVHTCFDRSETGSLQEQNPILLTCEARAFRVEVTDVNRHTAEGRPSKLVFAHQNKSQVLWQWLRGLAEERAELVWAGDLDGDDQVDLLIDHAGPQESTRLTLYLSSKARPPQLVGRVGTLVIRAR